MPHLVNKSVKTSINCSENFQLVTLVIHPTHTTTLVVNLVTLIYCFVAAYSLIGDLCEENYAIFVCEGTITLQSTNIQDIVLHV